MFTHKRKSSALSSVTSLETSFSSSSIHPSISVTAGHSTAVTTPAGGPVPPIEPIPAAEPTIATESHLAKRVKTEDGSGSKELKKKSSDTSEGLYDVIVHIKVGTPKEDLPVYRGKLCHVSPFFRGIYEYNVKPEASTECKVITGKNFKHVSFPSDDPAVFRRFRHWLYEKTILMGSETQKSVLWDVLFDLYLFALRCDIPGLQRTVVDMSIEKFKANANLPRPEHINGLYRNNVQGPQARGFRTLFVDMFVTGGRNLEGLANVNQYNTQFLCSLVKNLARLKTAAESDLKDLKPKKGKKSAKDVEEPVEEAAAFGKNAEKYYYRGESDPVVLDP